MIKRKFMDFLAKYYENKQKEYLESLMPRLKTKRYILDKETADKFNKYECYKQLLKGGYWTLWRNQVKNDKNKKSNGSS